MEPTDLFRTEVVDARQAQLYGTIRLAQPIGNDLVALLSLILCAALGTLLYIGEYTSKTTTLGVLLPQGGT